MRWPGKVKPGRVVREPATTLDFFPTFCDLAGAKRENLALDGISLAPLLLEGKPPAAHDLFWQMPRAAALRRGAWKYLRNGQNEMLFNLETNPGETKDWAAEKSELLRELKLAHAGIAATIPKQ